MKLLQRWYQQHPNLLVWAGLTLGMVIILAFSARNVGFTPRQWAALAAATVALAGACTWIISWESDDES